MTDPEGLKETKESDAIEKASGGYISKTKLYVASLIIGIIDAGVGVMGKTYQAGSIEATRNTKIEMRLSSLEGYNEGHIPCTDRIQKAQQEQNLKIQGLTILLANQDKLLGARLDSIVESQKRMYDRMGRIEDIVTSNKRIP